MPLIYDLPVRSTQPHYEFQCDLDGATYGFEFRWNERVSAWYMSIRDDSENLLLSEQRVVVGIPLAKRGQDDRLPPGSLVATDTSGADLDPGLGDLGTRVTLLYFATTEE